MTANPIETTEPNTPRPPGYICFTPSPVHHCAICGQPNRSPGAIAFINSQKIVCQSCVTQIHQLLEGNALIPFWD